MKIAFTIPSMSEQTIKEQLRGDIQLYDNYLTCDMEFYCDEENDKTGVWDTDVFRSYSSWIMKRSIAGCTVSRIHAEDLWECAVFSDAHKLSITTDTEQEARDISKRIQDWILA